MAASTQDLEVRDRVSNIERLLRYVNRCLDELERRGNSPPTSSSDSSPSADYVGQPPPRAQPHIIPGYNIPVSSLPADPVAASQAAAMAAEAAAQLAQQAAASVSAALYGGPPQPGMVFQSRMPITVTIDQGGN